MDRIKGMAHDGLWVKYLYAKLGQRAGSAAGRGTTFGTRSKVATS